MVGEIEEVCVCGVGGGSCLVILYRMIRLRLILTEVEWVGSC